MPSIKTNLGNLGEKAVVKYLESKGYKILDRNFQNSSGRRLGEIDIIAHDAKEDEIVFVEVKTRQKNNSSETLPEENITYKKLRRLAKIANAYLKSKKLEEANYRFDAVSVWYDKNENKAEIKHIPNL
jgi:putative endonuclease